MYTLFILILSFFVISISGSFTESSAESNWQMRPSLNISETYNSNIYSRTNETGDFITGIGARLNTSYTGANVALQTNYLATLNTYAHHPALNVVTHDGNVNVDAARWFRKLFREVNITVTENFTYTPELRDYYFDESRGGADPLSNYGIRTGRNQSFRNASSVEIRLPLSHNQNMILSYSNLLTEFPDPRLIDSVVHSLSMGTRYVSQRNTLSGNIGITRSQTGSVDLKNYFITTGLRHMFSPFTQCEASVGWDIIDHEIVGHTSNLRGALRCSTMSEFLTYNIGYSRELNAGSGVSTSPVVSQIVNINIGGRHTRHLSSSIRANYAENNSLRGDQVDIKSFNISAGAFYTIRAWLEGSLSVSHFRQDSEVTSAQDIKRNLIMLQLAASWGT
ncbi:MAG: hypothetical protein HZA08_09980 [Nitrospirae bacterium]|nr:hypothetical protein [Nitrospirota bacterium]